MALQLLSAYGKALLGAVRRGLAWRGWARQGKAWFSPNRSSNQVAYVALKAFGGILKGGQ